MEWSGSVNVGKIEGILSADTVTSKGEIDGADTKLDSEEITRQVHRGG